MKPDQIVQHARRIAAEYREQGLTLTLRQMYYQFVARGLMDNGQKVYDRIGSALTKARYAGRFPVDWLEDRGRNVYPGDFTRNDLDVDRALGNAGRWLKQLPELMLQQARWFGQPVHVSVWVEKEALAGIFEPACNRHGVSWFACRGYPSVSSLGAWLDQTELACGGSTTKKYQYGGGSLKLAEEHEGQAQKCVVLYFGDHDPDGWEIPRSAERNLYKLRAVRLFQSDEKRFSDEDGTDVDALERGMMELAPIEFIRVALNMDQIQEYDPPPFPAKPTSARYQSYLDEHDTHDAWELDALDPNVLIELIDSHVAQYFDMEILEENLEIIEGLRDTMLKRMRREGWAEEALR